MEVGVQLHISAALLQRKNFRYPLNRKLDGFQNRPGLFGERKSFRGPERNLVTKKELLIYEDNSVTN
jgi:hypothetical protein